MILSVVDTETTGNGDEDQVVDLAIVTVMPDGREVSRWSSLVKPTCMLSYEAMAIHHILPDELQHFWTMPELLAMRGLPELLSEGVVLVAHNAEFDLKMLSQSGVKRLPTEIICTWRCSAHVWPEAPNHKNQVLRYWLGIKVPDLGTLPPHRAMPDALVTSRILMRLLRERSVEELVTLTKEPLLLRTVRFGKHRGEAWKSVPTDYLRWVLGKDFDRDVEHTARHHLKQRG